MTEINESPEPEEDEVEEADALPVDIHEALERIEKDDPDGIIQTAAVVEAARDPESPLHREFEWDDVKAGHEHRLTQARQLITRYRIRVIQSEPVTIDVDIVMSRDYRPPQWVNAVVNGRRGYVSMERAVNDPDIYRQITNSTRKVLMTYRDRLAAFDQARPIVEAMDEAVELIKKQEGVISNG